MQNALAALASKHLSLDTLETRKSDSLDFSDQAVWNIKGALEAAYRAGQEGEAGTILVMLVLKDGGRISRQVERKGATHREQAASYKAGLQAIGQELAGTADRWAQAVLIDGAEVLNYTANEAREILGLE